MQDQRQSYVDCFTDAQLAVNVHLFSRFNLKEFSVM